MTPLNPLAATKRTLLYYPAIDIPPNTRWLRQAVMYWDEVASIVPHQHDALFPDLEKRYQKHMQAMRAAGLFRAIPPDALINDYQRVKVFGQELLAAVSSARFRNRLEPIDKRTFPSKIYRDKVASDVFHRLLNTGLAIQDAEDSHNYYFEENTGRLYMSLLARELAELDEQYTVAATDVEEAEALALTAQESELTVCRRVEFRDLLRVPREDVDLERVIEFRLAKSAELMQFRTEVLDRFQTELGECETHREIALKTTGFRSQVEAELSQLDRLLKSEEFPTVTGTLKAVCKPEILVTVAAQAGVAAGAGGPIAGAFVAIAGAIGAAAIEVCDFYATQRNRRVDLLTNSAYSYLYLANAELGN